MKQKFIFLISCLTLAAMVFSFPAWADDAELLSLVKNMQKQMTSMQRTIDSQNQKISALENRQPSSGGMAAVSEPVPMSDYEFNQRLDAATGGAQKWLKDLKFSGDLRLRYEAFHYGSGNPSETDDRNRFRYRLRYGLEKKFSEDMSVGFAMASGEQQGSSTLGDPTSTNTTFDNNFAFKQINVEKAFASYSPSLLKDRGVVKSVNFTGGKHNNPFEKGSSDMVWDRDVKPEGLSEKIDFALMDTENFDLNGYTTFGQYVLDEDATVGGDANLFAYQFGINPTFYLPNLERPVDFLQAFSFYDYSNYARSSNFALSTGSLARGNINADGVATELDAGKFKIFETYSEIGFTPMGMPLRFFLDYAVNPGDESSIVQNENDAYAFGLKVNSIVKKGDWELGYAYKEIGANAVVGAFNDSDFGDGHSGKRGHVLKAGYALTDSLTLNSAMFIVENLNSGTAAIIDQQQRRFQLDLVWKF